MLASKRTKDLLLRKCHEMIAIAKRRKKPSERLTALLQALEEFSRQKGHQRRGGSMMASDRRQQDSGRHGEPADENVWQVLSAIV